MKFNPLATSKMLKHNNSNMVTYSTAKKKINLILQSLEETIERAFVGCITHHSRFHLHHNMHRNQAKMND